MSVKRMITKLALAFAAKKGFEAFERVGGISGLQSMLKSDRATHRFGGARTAASTSSQSGEGLGGLLLSLLGGTDTTRTHASSGSGSLGVLLGSLASAFGQRSSRPDAERDMEAQLNTDGIKTDADAQPIMRAMVQMVRADGSIDAQEQSALFDILDDATPQEQAALRNALQEPVNAKAVAATTPTHARKEVYSAALLLGEPDKPKERSYLVSLASALGLRRGEVEDLHRAMGKPLLHS